MTESNGLVLTSLWINLQHHSNIQKEEKEKKDQKKHNRGKENEEEKTQEEN